MLLNLPVDQFHTSQSQRLSLHSQTFHSKGDKSILRPTPTQIDKSRVLSIVDWKKLEQYELENASPGDLHLTGKLILKLNATRYASTTTLARERQDSGIRNPKQHTHKNGANKTILSSQTITRSYTYTDATTPNLSKRGAKT